MSTAQKFAHNLPILAIGPELPGIGSWEWLGADLASALESRYDVRVFQECVPECDVALLLKYFPRRDDVRAIASRLPLVYCPIDRYGGSAEIDSHGVLLSRCAAIAVHSESLRRYFQSYAPVFYIDHPVKYVADCPGSHTAGGPILAVAVRNNLKPIIEWANSTHLIAPLWVLTDLAEGTDETAAAAELGFGSHNSVRIGRWSATRHRQWASLARAAVDVKGRGFRSRHKPPAKAIDFLASGLPLAVNAGHSAKAHLSRLGFELAEVRETERWFSKGYRQQCGQIGQTLRQQLSAERVAQRMHEIIHQVIEQRVAA